jgi:tetratricopeptide (TPR) repeat protein
VAQESSEAAYAQGIALAREKRWYEAEQAFLRAATLRPEASLAWLSVALMGFHLAHYHDIENAIGWALRAAPLRDVPEARRGVERFEAGDWHGAKAEFEKLLGKDLPLGEIYLPSDPPRMFKAIQATRKPCLVYKVLAAGRRIGSPAEIRQCFQTALANVKPTDALIVGMYQQFGDQVGENAALVRELCAG